MKICMDIIWLDKDLSSDLQLLEFAHASLIFFLLRPVGFTQIHLLCITYILSSI